jgi:phosphotriesterase-related protein
VKAVLAPNLRFDHLFNDVLPALRAMGVTEADINQMLIDNPRDIFRRTSA